MNVVVLFVAVDLLWGWGRRLSHQRMHDLATVLRIGPIVEVQSAMNDFHDSSEIHDCLARTVAVVVVLLSVDTDGLVLHIEVDDAH